MNIISQQLCSPWRMTDACKRNDSSSSRCKVASPPPHACKVLSCLSICVWKIFEETYLREKGFLTGFRSSKSIIVRSMSYRIVRSIRSMSFLSHHCQIKVEHHGQNYLLKLCKSCSRSSSFSVFSHGTSCLFGKEQLRVCLRRVDDGVAPRKVHWALRVSSVQAQ